MTSGPCRRLCNLRGTCVRVLVLVLVLVRVYVELVSQADCGHDGITKEQCLARGCCFDDPCVLYRYVPYSYGPHTYDGLYIYGPCSYGLVRGCCCFNDSCVHASTLTRSPAASACQHADPLTCCTCQPARQPAFLRLCAVPCHALPPALLQARTHARAHTCSHMHA